MFQTKNEIRLVDTGKKTAISLEFDEVVAAVLLPGEKIAWKTQPDGRYLAARCWIILPFAWLWTAFSLIWSILAFTAALNSIKSVFDLPVLLFSIPGLLFVAVGIALLKIPSLVSRTAETTFYVITNFRAFVIDVARYKKEQQSRLTKYESGGEPDSKAVTSYWPADMIQPEIRPEKKRHDRFDLFFAKSTDSDGDAVKHGFEGIDDADTPARLIERSLLKNKSIIKPVGEECKVQKNSTGIELELLNNKAFASAFFLFVAVFFAFGAWCIFIQENVKAAIYRSDEAIRSQRFDEALLESENAMASLNSAPSMACPRTFRAHLLENAALSFLRTAHAHKGLPLIIEAMAIREAVLASPGEDESTDVQRKYLAADAEILHEIRFRRVHE